MLRLHAAGMRAANLASPLLHWRVRADRHSLSSERYGADAFRRCKAHFLAETFLPPRPVVVWGAGKVGKPLARALLRGGVPILASRMSERAPGDPTAASTYGSSAAMSDSNPAGSSTGTP